MSATPLETRIDALTFNRPDLLNAFNAEPIGHIGRALQAFACDSAIHAIVVNGNGRSDFIIRFWDCPKSAIAALHGYNLADTFELALAWRDARFT